MDTCQGEQENISCFQQWLQIFTFIFQFFISLSSVMNTILNAAIKIQFSNIYVSEASIYQ